MESPKDRLEYLRGELRAECISYAELAELQSLAKHIDPGDVELLEAAGVPEDNPGKPIILGRGLTVSRQPVSCTCSPGVTSAECPWHN